MNIEYKFNPPEDEKVYKPEGKKYYITKGVAFLIPEDLVIQIFKTLDEKSKEQDLDYLQVLHIEKEKVWCIDDGTVITLLLPDEY